jgi:Rrf2 family protein
MATPTNTRFAVAVHVLTYLASCAAAGRATPVSSDELAGSTAVNPVHVRKVLGPLRTAGLVRSRPGAHGGWELAADPKAVNLAQVWQVLQGDDPVLGIHGPNPACPVGAGVQGALVDLDRRVARAVLTELEGISLNDVLDDSGFDPAAHAQFLC